MKRIAEERRLIAFDRVTDELKYPTDGEQRQRPTPTEEKQRQGNNDHRDSDRVRQTVQRMPVPGFVIIDQ